MPTHPSRQENALKPFHLDFPAEADRLAEVRRALHDWLAGIPIAAGLAHDVVLAAGEACTNAIEHGHRCDGGPVGLSASLTDDHIRVVVADHGRWQPGDTAADDSRGRGMAIMRMVSSEFEVETTESGTVVKMSIARQ